MSSGAVTPPRSPNASAAVPAAARRVRSARGASAVTAVVALLLAGCGGKAGQAPPAAAVTPAERPLGGVDAEQARSVVMSLADNYSQVVVQSLDELVKTTKEPARAEWARAQRLNTVAVSLTNATGPSATVALLDMVVFATLKRAAVEEHWLPSLLGEEGRNVAEAHRRGEAEAWAAAARVLSPSQVTELRELVREWQQAHPGQYYVGYTRFSDFDAFRQLSPESPQVKARGSLFAALYIDPLSGLDPVAREIRSYRALTERMTFILARLPILANYQLDLAVHGATGTPEVRQAVASTEKFAEATRHFADAVTRFPRDLAAERQSAVVQVAEATSHERQAALEQVARAVAAEREAILREASAQEGRVRAILGDVNGVLKNANEVGASVNAATTKTVTSAQRAANDTLSRATTLALILVAAALLGVPASLLGYGMLRRRLLRGPVDPTASASNPGPSS